MSLIIKQGAIIKYCTVPMITECLNKELHKMV